MTKHFAGYLNCGGKHTLATSLILARHPAIGLLTFMILREISTNPLAWPAAELVDIILLAILIKLIIYFPPAIKAAMI